MESGGGPLEEIYQGSVGPPGFPGDGRTVAEGQGVGLRIDEYEGGSISAQPGGRLKGLIQRVQAGKT